jgi:hypothetical protein
MRVKYEEERLKEATDIDDRIVSADRGDKDHAANSGRKVSKHK